jgi:hypothetical protein
MGLSVYTTCSLRALRTHLGEVDLLGPKLLCSQPDAEHDLQRNGIALDLRGLEEPIGQGVGYNCVDLRVWGFLH